MENKKNLRFIINNFKQKKDLYYFNYANYAKVPKSVNREARKINSIFAFGSIINKKMADYQDIVKGHVSSIFGGEKSRWFFLGTVSSVISNIGIQLIRDYINDYGRIPAVTTYRKNFPSLILPFQSYSTIKLCRLILLDYPENGIDEVWLKKNVKSDIFVISLVDFFNGFIHDLDLIHSHCVQNNIKLIVDFSQFPYWGILNVNNYNETIFISVLHKWLLGYPGYSISYINLKSRPFYFGWRNMKDIFNYDVSTFTDSHENSNITSLPFASFEGAYKLNKNIGFDKINKYIRTSREYIFQRLYELENKYHSIKILKNNEKYKDEKSSIISFTIENKAKDCFNFLKSKNIICSFFPDNVIRISNSFITYKEEIDVLIEVIEKWLKENEN